MKKIDFKKELKHLYNPSSKAVSFVDVPEMSFLMIDGQGDPNTSEDFQKAVEALFTVSYALKFMVKKGPLALDYGVLPLEGLWWVDDMTAFSLERKEEWLWTLMIMQPEFVTTDALEEAIAQVRKKKNPVALSRLRFESYSEGKAAQIMHIGPFSEEGPTIQKIHTIILDNGHELSGKHHEIYISDIRRTAHEKLKTVIRQPFQ